MTLPTVTITGNLTADPELAFGANGIARCSFTVAASDRKKDEQGNWVDGDTTFLRVTAWRQLAENVAENLRKGQRAIVVGRLRQNTVEKDGTKQTYFNLDAETVGLDLLWANKASKPAAREDDPWSSGAPF